MKYPLAEKFFAPQGEGLFAGTPMGFIRLVGCSVGQGTCHACDTDFRTMRSHMGGGLHEASDIVAWMGDCQHACLTGGEPLDRDLSFLVGRLKAAGIRSHIETSGTQEPDWLELAKLAADCWVCVSPKPGYRESMVARADEVKVVLGGLGDGPGWPTVDDALRWAAAGKLVYVQPRNRTMDVNMVALEQALAVVRKHPQLRLSVQLHKFIKTR